jgi:hypothetical protein
MAVQRCTEVVKAFRHAPPPRPEPRPARLPAYQPPGPAVLRYCAFCGRGEDETWQLVAGRGGHICGDCVLRACEAIADSKGRDVPPQLLRQWLHAWERVGAWLLAQNRSHE